MTRKHMVNCRGESLGFCNDFGMKCIGAISLKESEKGYMPLDCWMCALFEPTEDTFHKKMWTLSNGGIEIEVKRF